MTSRRRSGEARMTVFGSSSNARTFDFMVRYFQHDFTLSDFLPRQETLAMCLHRLVSSGVREKVQVSHPYDRTLC